MPMNTIPPPRLGIDDDENSDGSEEQLSTTTFSPLQKKEIELIAIRVVEQTIEPLLRRIMREEIGFFLINNEGSRLDGRTQNLKLHFLNKLTKEVLTGSKLKAENGNSVQVALLDEPTGETVKSGPGSSARVRILVLESPLHQGEEDLNKRINHELLISDSSKSLLQGNLFVRLNDGIGSFHDLSFRHSSRWLKKREFTLVATVVGDLNGIRVKPAVMDPFNIKDRRNKLYVKHDIPAPSDDIWRLKNISKGGPIHKSLSENNIDTVLAFLRELNLNPQRLRDLVGKEMSEKAFEDTVRNARNCGFNKETTYWYLGIVFNIVGEIMGFHFVGHEFITIDQLHDNDTKVIACNHVLSAFDSNENLLVPYHEFLSSSQSLAIPTSIDHTYDYEASSSSHHHHQHHHPVDLSRIFIAQKKWKLLYGVLRLIFKRRSVASEPYVYAAHKKQKMIIIR